MPAQRRTDLKLYRPKDTGLVVDGECTEVPPSMLLARHAGRRFVYVLTFIVVMFTSMFTCVVWVLSGMFVSFAVVVERGAWWLWVPAVWISGIAGAVVAYELWWDWWVAVWNDFERWSEQYGDLKEQVKLKKLREQRGW